MTKKKKIIITAVSVAAVVALSVSGTLIWRKSRNKFEDVEKIYVSEVGEINTAAAMSIAGSCFSGVVEPQKSHDIKYDTSKKVKDILVKEGDTVNAGTELFIYDVESMQLEQEQAQLDIERMQNEITANKKQITQLETEKKNASKDEQFSYTAQIQSLETDNAKLEYDIKVKNSEISKMSNSISNAAVVSEVDGTVGNIKSVSGDSSDENMDNFISDDQQSADVIMTITESGSFRIKGRVNEQNMGFITQDMPVVISSRADSTLTWNGTVSEISSEPENNQNNGMMYSDNDDMTTSSNYNFYIEPENAEGLMLGQHVIITPGAVTSDVEKTGIWLYEDYIVTDGDGNNFVWAADSHDKLEKRSVEIGEKDETMGDCQIVSGLEDTDKIAYPSDTYEEGMPVTTNTEDAVFSDDDGTDDGMIDDGMIDDGGIVDDNGVIEDEGIIDDGGVIDDEGVIDDGGIIDDGSSDTDESSVKIFDNIFEDSDDI